MEALFQTQALTGQVGFDKVEMLLCGFFQPRLKVPIRVDPGHGIDEPCDSIGHGANGEGIGAFTLRRHGQDKSSWRTMKYGAGL